MKFEDDFYDTVLKIIKCPECGDDARINMHIEEGQIVDYFYECDCGKITEGTY